MGPYLLNGVILNVKPDPVTCAASYSSFRQGTPCWVSGSIVQAGFTFEVVYKISWEILGISWNFLDFPEISWNCFRNSTKSLKILKFLWKFLIFLNFLKFLLKFLKFLEIHLFFIIFLEISLKNIEISWNVLKCLEIS